MRRFWRATHNSVLFCFVWFGLLWCWCFACVLHINSILEFIFPSFFFSNHKSNEERRKIVNYRCEIFNNLENLIIKSLNDWTWMEILKPDDPLINKNKQQSKQTAEREREKSCMKVFSDRKLYPNFNDTSVFVIGWIFGRLEYKSLIPKTEHSTPTKTFN